MVYLHIARLSMMLALSCMLLVSTSRCGEAQTGAAAGAGEEKRVSQKPGLGVPLFLGSPSVVAKTPEAQALAKKLAASAMVAVTRQSLSKMKTGKRAKGMVTNASRFAALDAAADGKSPTSGTVSLPSGKLFMALYPTKRGGLFGLVEWVRPVGGSARDAEQVRRSHDLGFVTLGVTEMYQAILWDAVVPGSLSATIAQKPSLVTGPISPDAAARIVLPDSVTGAKGPSHGASGAGKKSAPPTWQPPPSVIMALGNTGAALNAQHDQPASNPIDDGGSRNGGDGRTDPSGNTGVPHGDGDRTDPSGDSQTTDGDGDRTDPSGDGSNPSNPGGNGVMGPDAVDTTAPYRSPEPGMECFTEKMEFSLGDNEPLTLGNACTRPDGSEFTPKDNGAGRLYFSDGEDRSGAQNQVQGALTGMTVETAQICVPAELLEKAKEDARKSLRDLLREQVQDRLNQLCQQVFCTAKGLNPCTPECVSQQTMASTGALDEALGRFFPEPKE